MVKDTISKSLDLTPLEVDSDSPKQQVQTLSQSDPRNDVDMIRDNVIDVIDKGQMALAEMIKLAYLTESPRSYEVVAGLLKTIASANKDLLDIHVKQKELDKIEKEEKGEGSSEVSFTLSHADLVAALKNAEKE